MRVHMRVKQLDLLGQIRFFAMGSRVVSDVVWWLMVKQL